MLGLIEAFGRLPRSRLLDRLIQGRISIALVAFALIGIVTMQLGLLKLNAGIGRTLEREALLQRENATLSIENSELAAGDRVELHAGRLGMELISPGALRFLAVGNSSLEASRGAAALRSPVAVAAPGPAAAAGTTTGEAASGAAGSEAVSSASGEASSEAANVTPASSAAPSAAPAAETAAASESSSSSSSSSSEATAPAAGTGVAPASPSNGQSGGASEAATAPSASTGGGATAPSG